MFSKQCDFYEQVTKNTQSKKKLPLYLYKTDSLEFMWCYECNEPSV